MPTPEDVLNEADHVKAMRMVTDDAALKKAWLQDLKMAYAKKHGFIAIDSTGVPFVFLSVPTMVHTIIDAIKEDSYHLVLNGMRSYNDTLEDAGVTSEEQGDESESEFLSDLNYNIYRDAYTEHFLVRNRETGFQELRITHK